MRSMPSCDATLTQGRQRTSARPRLGAARLHSAACAAALGAAVLGGSLSAAAQTDQDRSFARTAATEGYKACQTEQWADCYDLFSRAEALVHAPPHLLYMGRALTKLGRLVEARETYMRAIKENIAETAPKAFHAAQESSRQELAQLEPRLPHVRIVLEGADGAEVRVSVDGKEIPSALIGLPMPVDPGSRTIMVQAEGKSANPVERDFAEGAHEKVIFVLEPDPDAHLPSAATAPQGAAAADSAAAPPAANSDAGPASDKGGDVRGDTGEPAGNSLRLVSYAALGVGAVGLGLGTVFALQSSSKSSDRDALCPDPQQCPVANRDQVIQLNEDAGSAQTLAVVGFALGGLGVATGVTLFVLSSGSEAEEARLAPHIAPWVGLGSAGVRGRF